MRIQKRSMNWLPKPSLYAEQAAKRAKQRATHQAFIGSTSSLTTTVSNVLSNQTAEMGNIISNTVLQRVKKSA